MQYSSNWYCEETGTFYPWLADAEELARGFWLNCDGYSGRIDFDTWDRDPEVVKCPLCSKKTAHTCRYQGLLVTVCKFCTPAFARAKRLIDTLEIDVHPVNFLRAVKTMWPSYKDQACAAMLAGQTSDSPASPPPPPNQDPRQKIQEV